MTTSTSKNPSFTYPDTGTYTVSMTVTLPSTKFATVTKTIDVFQLGDTSYTYSTSCNEATFTDTSVAPNIISWHWDFGDGTSSDVQNPVHDFPMAFNYAVHLTIRTLNGGIGFTSQNIVITGGTVTSSFTYVPTGLSFAFTDTSTVDCGAVAWTWDFGDGNTSELQNPTNVYSGLGTYTVTLTVYDAIGDFDISSQVISTGWSELFDFTIDDGGWDTWGTYLSNYVPGVGWQNNVAVYTVTIKMDIPSATNVTYMKIIYQVTGTTIAETTGLVGTITGAFSSPPTYHEGYNHDVLSPPHDTDIIWDHIFDSSSVNALSCVADIDSAGFGVYFTTIKSIEVHGLGVNPF